MEKLTLGVHPRIVFQLGESLVTDPVQALIELIKNSYDADATFVSVTVDTFAELKPTSKGATATGRIVVRDNGTGMDEEVLEKGWLTISVSPKAGMKSRGDTSPRFNRAPLGDKGVGRLGTQRLGHKLIIDTFADPDPHGRRTAVEVEGLHLEIDWRNYDYVERLDEVTFEVRPSTRFERPGTTLTLEGLKDAAEWRGPGRKTLGAALSKLLSPFDPPSNFTVDVIVDDGPVELAQVEDIVRSAALASWSVTYDGEHLVLSGSVRATFLRPDRKDQSEWVELVQTDHGKRLLQALTKDPAARDLGLHPPSSPEDVAAFSISLSVADLDSEFRPGAGGADPGPFTAVFEAFSLGRQEVQEQVADYLDATEQELQVFSREAEYRSLMKDLAGVRVYRDGFGVRVGGDWLGLGAAFTSAQSFRALRPGNTIGFVNISADANRALVETTDREGFVQNAAYKTFVGLLGEALGYFNRCQVVVGRGWDSLKKSESRTRANVPQERPTRNVASGITEAVRRAERLGQSVEDAQRAIARSSASSPQLKQAEATLKEVEEILARLPEIRAQAELVELELNQLEESRSQFVEMIGLGLTAEALAHEITAATNRLDAATREIKRGQSARSAERVARYISDVQHAINSLRKQIAHLDPALRYTRDVRREVSVIEFLSTLADYHRGRWGNDMTLHLTEIDNFEIRANPGRLTQVFDNLLLNSEYWAGQTRGAASIWIEVDRPFVRIWDSGPGIHPSVAQSLFEPFISRKPRGKGRGLGLFVARQLLDLEHCTISVTPEPNPSGRLYMFEIDFSGATVGG